MVQTVDQQNNYSHITLELSYKNCNKLADFLTQFRGPKNDNSGKYGVPLKTIQHLFNETWIDIPTTSGHIKLQHSITKVIVNYKNHDNDPVDPGAVITLANAVQEHINIFYRDYLGCSTRDKNTIKPDFRAIAKRLNDKNLGA